MRSWQWIAHRRCPDLFFLPAETQCSKKPGPANNHRLHKPRHPSSIGTNFTEAKKPELLPGIPPLSARNCFAAVRLKDAG